MYARPRLRGRSAGARGGGGWGRVFIYTHTKKAIETEAEQGQSA